MVGDPPVGTTFRATQDGATLPSEPWRGKVRAVTPPRVEGDLRVGGHVRPVAAEWEGGWGRDATGCNCRPARPRMSPVARWCSNPIKFGACPGAGDGRFLPARYEGWWLRVADARIDIAQPFTLEAYFRPEGIRPLAPSPAIAVVVAGRIAPGQPPSTDFGGDPPGLRPSPPPEAMPSAVVRRIIRRAPSGKLVAVRVTCAARCALEVVVRQGRRTIATRRRLRRGTTNVAVPRVAARRLPSGAVGVRVLVDGRRVAAAQAVLRR